jgi:hypothetical protein
MTRVNLIRCDVCGHEEHADDVWIEGKAKWLKLPGGKHACSVECYIRANPLNLERTTKAKAKGTRYDAR